MLFRAKQGTNFGGVPRITDIEGKIETYKRLRDEEIRITTQRIEERYNNQIAHLYAQIRQLGGE